MSGTSLYTLALSVLQKQKKDHISLSDFKKSLEMEGKVSLPHTLVDGLIYLLEIYDLVEVNGGDIILIKRKI